MRLLKGVADGQGDVIHAEVIGGAPAESGAEVVGAAGGAELPLGTQYGVGLSGEGTCAHQEHLQWTPERIASWAGSIGPNCRAAVLEIMASRPIPEHGFRPCLGVIRLGKRYSHLRVDGACERALKLNIVG